MELQIAGASLNLLCQKEPSPYYLARPVELTNVASRMDIYNLLLTKLPLCAEQVLQAIGEIILISQETISMGGKESETVDSLLKLLRKHSGEQSKKQVSNFNSEKQLQRDDDASERQNHSSSRFDSRNKDHNATPFTRPASSFRRNSPVPRHKSQASYSSEAIFYEASSYSVTWTQKKDQVESRDEPEYELEPESAAEYDEPEPEAEYEPESEPELAILESLSELKLESFYQEEDEDEEDHNFVIDELSDDDESLNTDYRGRDCER
ncbi:unnamed protein product [Arabidopsis thaliana]|uniref:Uncharacterized protein n=1 Tax=Arabidopsis thaliana TaxID=3702 RepID=A0A5S9X2W8_ARATH|nr:unnamed protein product [Arabidopsis thaliana]